MKRCQQLLILSRTSFRLTLTRLHLMIQFKVIILKILLGWLVCLLNGISTFMVYLMPNPSLKKNSSITI